MAKRQVYHVTKNQDSGWDVKKEGGQKTSGNFGRKPSSAARDWQRMRLSVRSRFTARMVSSRPNILTGMTRIHLKDKGKE